jgi:hypothetical protein
VCATVASHTAQTQIGFRAEKTAPVNVAVAKKEGPDLMLTPKVTCRVIGTCHPATSSPGMNIHEANSVDIRLEFPRIGGTA